MTARTQAEHDLLLSETRYRRLFESAKDGILILEAGTGRIVDVNPFLVNLLGYSHADLVGKHLWDIGLFKDIAASKETFLALQAKGYMRYETLPLEAKDGRRIDVEFVSNVYQEGATQVIQCNIRDVTERRRLDKRRELLTQVLALLNRGNDINQLVGDILQLLKLHTGIEAIGIRLREGEDFPYYETDGLPSHFVAAERNLCARDASGEIVRDENGTAVLECMCGNVLRGRFDPAKPCFTPQGSFWTNSTTALLASTAENSLQSRTRNRCNDAGYESVALIPLRLGNEVIGLIQLNDHRKGMFTPDAIAFYEELGSSIGVAVARRWAAAALEKGLAETEQSRKALVTLMADQKRAAEEREQMRAQLLQSQKLESIGTLAGGVAHEINNPIMGIMNYAQLILDRLGPDSPVSEYADEIGKESVRVATIVKNLLGFARQDKETLRSPARLCDIIESTLSLIGSVMRHDQIALEVDVPRTLPPIKCRTQQIQQVVMNLLTNARDALNQKYAGGDSSKIIRITARSFERDGQLWTRTTVEDRGNGIPEKLRGCIFEPFFTTKPRDKGTGLGLSISHGIVKDHGGDVSVESEVGEWTRFHVDLPAAPAEEPPPRMPQTRLPVKDGAP